MITWETEKKDLTFLQLSQFFLSVSKILMQNFLKLFSFSRHHTLSTTYANAPAYITNHGQPTNIRETQSRKTKWTPVVECTPKGMIWSTAHVQHAPRQDGMATDLPREIATKCQKTSTKIDVFLDFIRKGNLIFFKKAKIFLTNYMVQRVRQCSTIKYLPRSQFHSGIKTWFHILFTLWLYGTIMAFWNFP